MTSVERYNYKRSRLMNMESEIQEAEMALSDPMAPDHVKHFYSSQLPMWRDRYKMAERELNEIEREIGIDFSRIYME